MLVSIILVVFFCVNGSLGVRIEFPSSTLNPQPGKVPCGMEMMPNKLIEEGFESIERFPWMGLLIYPINNPRPTTTTVVMVTRQIALTTALEIDYYPKDDFRARSRVVLGNNCTGPYIRILDYTFHPDFARTTYSSLALIQLDTTSLWKQSYHICPPPQELEYPVEIYALVMVNDCYNSSMVDIYKMEHVDPIKCTEFYRQAELDMETMRPTHVACARGSRRGHCIWRSGTVLVIRQEGRWRLLGVGTYGPGCESPARFLDYSMYRHWVQRSLIKIGQPTVTRLSPGHIILRRTSTNIPRYGPCDPEERKTQIFSDVSTIIPPAYIDGDPYFEPVKYNMTLLDNVEYHCIDLQASNILEMDTRSQPEIRLRRWCTRPPPLCAEPSSLKVHYFVEINVLKPCYFKVTAYGLNIDYVNEQSVFKYIQKWVPRTHSSIYKAER